MARNKMTTRIEDGYYIVEFDSGASKKFCLPDRGDGRAIKDLADKAVEFAIAQDATIPGQVNAVRKGLTNAGYYIIGPR